MIKEVRLVSYHDGLGDFDARRNQQQPSRNSGDTKNHQSYPECQEPSPVLNEFARNLNSNNSDVAHRHASLPKSDCESASARPICPACSRQAISFLPYSSAGCSLLLIRARARIRAALWAAAPPIYFWRIRFALLDGGGGRCALRYGVSFAKHGDRDRRQGDGRGTAEQWIKEGKNAAKWTRLSCCAFAANAVRLQLHALGYNLANFLRTLALPDGIEKWSLTSLREKLVKIGAKLVAHRALQDLPNGGDRRATRSVSPHSANNRPASTRANGAMLNHPAPPHAPTDGRTASDNPLNRPKYQLSTAQSWRRCPAPSAGANLSPRWPDRPAIWGISA